MLSQYHKVTKIIDIDSAYEIDSATQKLTKTENNNAQDVKKMVQ